MCQTTKYFHKQFFEMNNEELEVYSRKKNDMYRDVVNTLIRVMNDPLHNAEKKMSAREKLMRLQVK